MAKLTVFTLTSGRSGTQFLCGLLRKNLPDATVFHEPYLRRGNPNMFGLPIYDHWAGNRDAVRQLVAYKRDTIRRYGSDIYIETSHALLKSWWEFAPEYFPDLKLLHLIRHPLEVARSEANRHAYLDRWHFPFRNYTGRDGQRYFRWALTGHEAIYNGFDLAQLTLFQRYLLQWIEIENRAMTFLQRFNLQTRCLTLHTPNDLTDPDAIQRLFEFIGRVSMQPDLRTPLSTNQTPGQITTIGAEEISQCREIIERLPTHYLEIFHHPPYAECTWHELLQKR